MDARNEEIAAQIKEQLLSAQQLIEKAAVFLGLGNKNEEVFSGYRLKPLCQYELTGEFLKALQTGGFEYKERPDGVITLSGESNKYWNFRRREGEKDKLLLSLELLPNISEPDRGVVFTPMVFGTFLSPGEVSISLEVFRVVLKNNLEKHPLIHKVVAADGKLVVTWTNIQLGGIRSLQTLFEEFVNRNKKINELRHNPLSPFDFQPHLCRDLTEPYYLPESIQPLILQLWRYQLENFVNALNLY